MLTYQIEIKYNRKRDYFQGNIYTTVKLDFKELLNKEQIDFKELFTDY